MVRIARLRLLPALIFLTIASQARTQELGTVVDATYRITLNNRPVSGTLWLYYYASRYLDRVEIAPVTDGRASVRWTTDAARAIRAIPNPPDAFLVALFVSGVGWFRSPDFRDLEGGVAPAIASLGQEVPSGTIRTVVLTPPVLQTIELQNPDGSPRANVSFDVSLFVTRGNGCVVNADLDMGGRSARQRLRTDQRGRTQITLPLVDLYADLPFYSESRSSAGLRLTSERGLILKAQRAHVIRETWSRYPDRMFRIVVTTPAGTVAPRVAVFWAESRTGCGTFDPIGTTNVNGEVAVQFAPEHTDGLWLQSEGAPPGQQRQDLTAGQLAELFQTGTLQIKFEP